MEHDAYRLFGNLYLESPGPNTLLARKLQRLQPYIRALECKESDDSDKWDSQVAFLLASKAEVACWETHGVERDSRFLIPPDGQLNAALSCHLHNPNFNVVDPYTSRGADDSNLSIHQIMSAGFTLDKVLIYDHTFRREPVDGLAAYPPNVLEVHEKFTSDLRKHMASVIDVVWGAPVRERMKKTHRLEELQLWGQYHGVSIFLEWEIKCDELRRFVIFVYHPEAMMYGEPRILGKKQDLHLKVASRLSGVQICDNFYEQLYRPEDRRFLSGPALSQRNALNEKAISELQSVVDQSSHIFHAHRQRRRHIPHDKRKSLQRYPGLYQYFAKKVEQAPTEESDDDVDADLTDAREEEVGTNDSLQIHAQIASDFIGPKWLKMFASSLIGNADGNATVADAINISSALANGEFDLSGTFEWYDFPRMLRSWLERQDGLKVNRSPIVSVHDLLLVHGLILKKPALLEENLPISVTQIFLELVRRYYHLVVYAARSSRIDHLIVRRAEPVPLKCSHCKSRLLDDAFPRFKKSDQERYVAHRFKRGCGSKTCQAGQRQRLAVPYDECIPWAAPKATVLERPRMKADWTAVLLRQDSGTIGLPAVVQIICRACDDQSSVQED